MIEFLVNRIKDGTNIYGKPFTVEDAISIIESNVPKELQNEYKKNLKSLLVANNITVK